MKNRESVILRDMPADYPETEKFVVKMSEQNSVSKTMINETRLVFEALCYKIFEQRENPKSEVTVSGFRRMGDSAIEITFYGGRFDPEPADPSVFDLEDSILKAYADKIDFSYRSGRNRITITSSRNHLANVVVYAASIILGIAVYALLHFTGSEEIQHMVANEIVAPLEQLFVNATLMIGGPVTFLSLLKHLTDTYILAESTSNARRLHRNTITSSMVSVILAIIGSRLLMSLMISDNPARGLYTHGEINLDPVQLIPSLIPSDIFTPFQMTMPYALIILAALTTYAFCSVGKHFDRMKDTIDSAYVLFARMLSVVMYVLPVCAFCSVMEALFTYGFEALIYLSKLIAAVAVSLILMLVYYILRLATRGIRPWPFLKRMIPLLRENARIASAFDAVPYNIRYCIKTYGFDRNRLEKTMPILAQINLDGNCFLITMIALLFIAMLSTPLSTVDTIAIGILVLLLSLGAPNQPGSCLVGLTIVMTFIQADNLTTIALLSEVFFGSVLNLTNIVGDLITVASEEVRERGSADELNAFLEQKAECMEQRT